MKKIILLALIGLVLSPEAKATPPAGTTFTSPSSGTVTVTNASQWTGTTTPNGAGAWTSSGSGTPYTYVISSGFTVIISGTTTVSLTANSNDILTVSGQLGFASGANKLVMGTGATINVPTGGKVGFGSGANYQGNSSANITIGSNAISGPFLFTGPETATQSNNFLTSTSWKGSVDNTWGNLGNWTNGYPGSAKDVIIPNGMPNDPTVTISASSTYKTIKRLHVYPGANLTLEGGSYPGVGANLTVTDSLVNYGTITISTLANLQQSTTSYLGGNGTYNVAIQINGDNTFLTSPINNVGVSSFGIIPTGTDGGQLIPKSTCDPSALDPSSPSGNLLELNENATIQYNCSQSFWFVKSAGNLTNGRGYSLYAPTHPLLTFSGTINNGSVSYTGLTRQTNTTINNADGSTTSTGWNIVGNPYPSGITLTGGNLTSMGFDAQIQIWDNGSWLASNPLSPTIIPAGQGFQIRKTAVGGTSNFTLDNSFRQASNDYLRSSSPLQQNFINIALRDSVYTDTTMVYFYNGATDGFDPAFDADRLSDQISRPMIYSIVNNEKLRYNALPYLSSGQIKQDTLGIRTAGAGTHTLTFNSVSTLGVNVVLQDLKLNTTQPVTDSSVYKFTTAAGDNQNRFVLRMGSAAGVSAITTGTVATAISSPSNNNSVQLFPNPTSGTTSLSLNANDDYTKVLVVDFLGRTVQTYELNKTDTVKILNTDELSNGVYFIKLVGTNQQLTLKLIKQL
jgi:hypothetical protein